MIALYNLLEAFNISLNVYTSTGVGLHLTGVGPLPNNSIIIAGTTRAIGDLQCISASETPNIGQFISPSGQDLLNESIPFNITVGGQDDPGRVILSVAPEQVIRGSDGGIYTCIIPDEAGVEQAIHVGIYENNFNSKWLTMTSQPSYTQACRFLSLLLIHFTCSLTSSCND